MPKRISLLLRSGRLDAWATVDEEDFDHLMQWPWQRCSWGYAKRSGKTHPVLGRCQAVWMHRVVAERAGMQIKGLEVDHINGDPLDNRRANLRPATRMQNAKNIRRSKPGRSGIAGVRWNQAIGKWEATITSDGRVHYLGAFDTIESAAAVRAMATQRYHGAFARRT